MAIWDGQKSIWGGANTGWPPKWPISGHTSTFQKMSSRSYATGGSCPYYWPLRDPLMDPLMDPLTDPLMDLLTDPNNPVLYIDWIIYILKIWHILYPISMGLKHIQLKFYQHYLVIGITLMMSFLMSDWFLYTLYFCHFLYKVSLGLVKSPANHNVFHLIQKESFPLGSV